MAVMGNTDFQLPPKIFYWVQVWSLARPLQDLVMFLTEPPLLCVSGRCYAGRPSHDSSSMFLLKEGGSGQDLMIHGPIHPHLLNMVQSSFPLCRKWSPKNDVFTSMIHGWDGVLGVVLILLFPPNTAIGVQTKKLFFLSHQTTLHISHSSCESSRWSLANFRL